MTSVIFSLEMSRTEIVMRMLSAEAKIRLGDMRGGRMTDDDWTRLHADGLTHLIAISGFHVGMVASVACTDATASPSR